jgi:hypothetical protein
MRLRDGLDHRVISRPACASPLARGLQSRTGMRFLFTVVVVALAAQAWPQTLIQSPPPRVYASADDLMRAQRMAEQAKKLQQTPRSRPSLWRYGANHH